MTLDIALVLGLLLLAITLFATEKLGVDLVTLIMLCALGASRILTPAEVFAGFSNEILIILASTLLLTVVVLALIPVFWEL